MVFTPPVLPLFLASTYELKPAEGVPSDEEVKMVHSVIRALNDVANAHIPVELEPVTGPPSDSQIKSVQAASRLSENLSNGTSPVLPSTQHLFDIQFERYLRQVADGDPSAPMTSSRAGDADVNDPKSANPSGVHINAPERTREQGDLDMSSTVTTASGSVHEPMQVHSRGVVSRSAAAARNSTELPESVQPEHKQDFAQSLKVGLEDTNLLIKLGGGLEDLKRILIGMQHSMARAINSAYLGRTHAEYTSSFINTKGEVPE
ncbi:hypothetical protein FRC10_003457, partial [Ceratobasidium sp. 414]